MRERPACRQALPAAHEPPRASDSRQGHTRIPLVDDGATHRVRVWLG
jgi:hypothetical protein